MMVYIKLLLFIWAISELAIGSVMYWYAYKKMKRSKIIGAIAILLTVGTLSVLQRFMTTYVTAVSYNYHSQVKNLTYITMPILAMSARRFRKASLDPVQVREEIRRK